MKSPFFRLYCINRPINKKTDMIPVKKEKHLIFPIYALPIENALPVTEKWYLWFHS